MGTEASDRQHSEQHIFECTHCGTRRAATHVEYDDLGYPICPVCTTTNAPI